MRQIRAWLVPVGCAAWAVFANLCDQWALRPSIEEGGVLGVLAVTLVLVLWFTSVPRTWKRTCLVFTGFALLLGTGWCQLEAGSWWHRLALGAVMSFGMMLVAWLAARIRWLILTVTAVVIGLLNAWVPIANWPVLTHFWVAGSGRVQLDSEDFPAAPLDVVEEPNGDQALVTLSRVRLTPDEQRAWLDMHHASQKSFSEAAYGLNHLYALMEIHGGRFGFSAVPASADLLAQTRPNTFAMGLFPLETTSWAWFENRAVLSVLPSLNTQRQAQIASDVAGLPAALTNLGNDIHKTEEESWSTSVKAAGGSPDAAALRVDGNVLHGVFSGRPVNVQVPAGSTLIAVGSLTGPDRHDALLAAGGKLVVVALDEVPARIVAVHAVDVKTPLSNDLFIGPLDNPGRDVIYLNTVPAQILTVDDAGRWQTLYTAPNGLFRFETAVSWGPDRQPEILVNDPAAAGDSQVRYLTSYTWRQGRLVRNWRVYWPDFVNIQTFRPNPGGPVYLVGSEYGSGEWLILRRHFLPVLPVLLSVLGAVCLAGWWLRWRMEWSSCGKGLPWLRRPWFALAGMACLGGLVTWAFQRAPASPPVRMAQDAEPFVMTPVVHPTQADASLIAKALERVKAASAYKVNLTCTLTSGAFHTAYRAYGSVNPPDHIGLSLVSGNASASWYQWGQAAYQTYGGAWMPVDPVKANIAESVQPLVDALASRRVPLKRVGTAYVVDEYCDVYQAEWSGLFPNSDVALLMQPVNGQMDVYFCVGKTDHALKEVDVRSVSGVSGEGPMFAETQVIFTALNDESAKVQTPPGLLIALQHAQ